MPTTILMPALSPTMEQGKLAKWLKKEGDKISSGDALAEIETDKATMEVEAADEGTLGKIMVPEGTEGVAVNTPIAVLLAEDEDAAALKDFDANKTQPQAKASESGGQSRAQTSSQAANGGGLRAEKAKTPEPDETKPTPEREAGSRPPPEGNKIDARPANCPGRIFASPLARRLAAEAGLELSQLRGSGPHGRIVKTDIESAVKAGTRNAESAPAAQNGQALVPSRAFPAAMSDEQILALYPKGSYEIRPLDNMRKTIALRLTQAATSIPHFRLTVDCGIDSLLDARQRLNERSPKEGPKAYKLSVNDFIIKAMGLALQRIPDANATFTERGLLMHKSSDVGVAVAVEGGLFTPVIRNVERKTLAEISEEMKDLARRARKRRLAPHEYQGGTTAISNLGMFGIDSFDAVINPPHASILAAGRSEKRPVVKDGQIVAATMMSCTLSCDHRVIDGALGAKLLTAFKGFIEEPVTMLL
jgi:pyruvate dehydrogenase E2 component (dihydrolipoamide acetyltransferase)